MTSKDIKTVAKVTVQVSVIVVYAATAAYYASLSLATARMMVSK